MSKFAIEKIYPRMFSIVPTDGDVRDQISTLLKKHAPQCMRRLTFLERYMFTKHNIINDPICVFYNQNRCTSPNCQYRHVCIYCLRNHTHTLACEPKKALLRELGSTIDVPTLLVVIHTMLSHPSLFEPIKP